jgi:hypothetical protein
MKDRLLKERPTAASIIERQVSAAADIGSLNPNASR